jgi:hypothetical protein
MGGPCSICGERIGIWFGNLSERDYLAVPGLDVMIIDGSSGSRCGVIDWIVLAQDREGWRVL